MAKKSKPADESAAAPTAGESTDRITIAGHEFAVPVRYSAGHVLTEGEASALNQTFHENLRNNFAKTVKDAKVVPADGDVPASTRELGPDDLAGLQSKLDAYAGEYQFGVRAAGGTRTPADPVGREALNLAKAAIRDKLREVKKTATAEQIAELAAQLVEKNPKFREIAAQRVEAAKNAAAISLDDIAA